MLVKPTALGFTKGKDLCCGFLVFSCDTHDDKMKEIVGHLRKWNVCW
jgi:hypothetical protein